MIRTDRCDIGKMRVKILLFVRRAQRRRAFCDRAEPFHVFVRQQEIMRARFAADVHSTRIRFGDDFNSAAAADMDDVQATTGFACKIESQTDRIEFGLNRTRFKKIPDRSFSGSDSLLR